MNKGDLRQLARNIWSKTTLFRELLKRELVSRYRTSVLGALWQVLSPLLLLLVYGFVFGLIFRVRWGGAVENSGGVHFVAALFCGLSVFGLYADVLNRSTTLIVAQANYVKKVVFPLGLLSVVCVTAATWTFLINCALLLLFMLLTGQGLSWLALLLPLLLLPFMLLMTGVSWFLAALGMYLRDINQIIGLVTTFSLFLSPVFYPMEAIPETYRWLFYINPLTYIVESFRNILIFGQMPGMLGLVLYWVLSGLSFLLGYRWFQRLRGGFADAL